MIWKSVHLTNLLQLKKQHIRHKTSEIGVSDNLLFVKHISS